MAIDIQKIVPLNRVIATDIQKELRLQGHLLTGKLERSFETVAEYNGGNLILEAYAAGYIEVLENGVRTDKIPYDSSKVTGAKTSKYIQGLKLFAMQRFGVGEKEGLSIAFAIAKKHEKEGMPSVGSKRFSSTGDRKNAILDTFIKNEERYFDKIDEAVVAELDKQWFATALEVF
jgi:hypothetical protein